MSSTPVHGNPLPHPNRIPALQQQNPAPHAPNRAPQVDNVVVPDDPRGTKRAREEGSTGSEEPVLKLARTESVSKPFDPKQALVNAIERGDLREVTALISSSMKLINSYMPLPGGPTPLCLAASVGKLGIVNQLLSLGALDDTPAENGNTPLMFAAENGHLKVIECLGSGALKAINKTTGRDALCCAIVGNQLEACKLLIAKGADINRKLELQVPGKSQHLPGSPVGVAIKSDYSELLAWLLDQQMLDPNSTEITTGKTLLNCAATAGSVAVCNLLLERGANLDWVVKTADNKVLSGIWELAVFFKRHAVIECLLNRGHRPKLDDSGIPDFSKKVGISLSTDLCIQLIRQDNGRTTSDGLKEDEFRRFPEKAIEGFARAFAGYSKSDLLQAVNWWMGSGLLYCFIYQKLNGNYLASARLLGKNEHFVRPFDKPDQAVPAQQLQLLIEFMSWGICAPGLPQLYSTAKLTPESAQKMNQIAVAQGELLLKGIARLRERFAQQVATLPGICVDTYISVSHQLNEPDLYRKMTMEWGLYDPVARAASRLVKQAYEKLRELSGKQVPAEFAALSLSERLRHVMVDMLEEWDKVPEIVAAILESGKDKEAGDVPDLLFQQWRLLCEAFGVIKPREFPPSLTFGPHKPEDADEPATMEVDDAPVVKAPTPPVPLTLQ